MQLITTPNGAIHALAHPYGDGGETRCTLDAVGPRSEGRVADVTCRLCQDSLRATGWRQRWPVATRIG